MRGVNFIHADHPSAFGVDPNVMGMQRRVSSDEKDKKLSSSVQKIFKNK